MTGRAWGEVVTELSWDEKEGDLGLMTSLEGFLPDGYYAYDEPISVYVPRIKHRKRIEEVERQLGRQ